MVTTSSGANGPKGLLKVLQIHEQAGAEDRLMVSRKHLEQGG